MLTFEEARDIIFSHTIDLEIEQVILNDSLDRILMEDLHADRDFPPFDRVTMDGIAIQYSQLKNGQTKFEIENTLGAGDEEYVLQDTSKCVEIMTGAMLPINCDTVIRYEDLEIKEGIATIRIDTISIRERQNIHFRGLDHKKGELLVTKGSKISPAEISVAATVGKTHLNVLKPPTALIISTGNELVAIDSQPKPHQIRRSNTYTLQAILTQHGWGSEIHHLPDDPEVITAFLKKALSEYKVLIFSGGVSAGKFDHVPNTLKELGIKEHFHKVKQRPGKPLWFGTSDQGHTIFAFPGNPVSMFMCCYVYFIPWALLSANQDMESRTARLSEAIHFDKPLTLFKQVRTTLDHEGVCWAHEIKSHGSGDFANLVNGDGILILPAEKEVFKKGESYPVIFYR